MGSTGSFPEYYGGEWAILPDLILDVFKAKELSAQANARIERLSECLILADQLYEHLEEEVAAGRVDAREAENINVSSHVVELVYKHPGVPWISFEQCRLGLKELDAICRDAPLFHSIYLTHRSRYESWLQNSEPGTPTTPSAEEKKLMQGALEEICELAEALRNAEAKGFEQMFLCFQ